MSEIEIYEWAIAFFACMLLGMSKAGIKGIAIVFVTLMALVFGSKESTGVVLPLLTVGDIFAVRYYHQHAERKHLKKLLPWLFAGVILGTWLGYGINEELFQQGMAVIIIISLIMMVVMDIRKVKSVPGHWSFGGAMGLSAGFTTMVGNLAGAFTNVYFLAMQLPKNRFIGTAAWLYLLLNLFKLPFHVFVWKTVNADSLIKSSVLVPAVILGIFVGIKLVGKIPEKWYRRFIIVMTFLGALALFLR